MRRALLPIFMIGAVWAFPGVSFAQAPTQDSVTGSGQWTALLFDIDARSGPSGESPSGQVTFSFLDGRTYLSGPATCLAVRGNVATINFLEDGPFFAGVVTVQVTDNGPSGSSDQIDGALGVRSAGDCSPLPGGAISDPGLVSGDIVVVDAKPFPTSKDQCKNGGWRNYPDFKNEGDCVSFVTTKGKNPPANSP
jgi:hypothetical protein